MNAYPLKGLRKFFLLFSFFCLLLSVFCHCEAQAAMAKGPALKFSRGIAHILASPFQIPKEIIQTTAEADPVYLAPFKGMSVGAGTGLYYAGRQLISGFYDIFTFWTPMGRNWDPLFESASLFPQI